jgi:O-antigen ligase
MTVQTKPMQVTERPGSRGAGQAASEGRRRFVFGAIVVFCWLYYYRPEDFIPGLHYIPMAKIAGIIGIVALLVGVMGGGSRVKMPWAIKILWLLLFQTIMCIPFAIWSGGAFATVFDKLAKGVVVATLISMAVVTVHELRKLLWIQVSAVAIVTFFSILVRHHDGSGRLSGIQKSILENPNDLAINIAIGFPLGVAFMLHARGLKKAVWAIALIFMSLGIILTESRSGLLAFIISVMICIWEYGIKGKRRYLIAIAAAAMFVGMCIAVSSSHYRARVESIVLGNIEGSGDKGSLEARKALLKKSIMVALAHPIFGVGPGGFILVDKGWVVAHNTYTELAAESGILALILFLLAMGAAFKNISRVRKSQQYQDDPEFRLFTQALRAGIVAYLAGACFASTEYLLYSYLLVAYSCAMVQIINQPLPSYGLARKGQRLRRSIYDRVPRPQPIWSR